MSTRNELRFLTLFLAMVSGKALAQSSPAGKEGHPAAKSADLAKNESKPAAAPPTHKIASELLKQTLTMQGTFEAAAASEVYIRPESWTDFVVLEAVEHGKPVKKGEVLIRFNSEKLDEAIQNLEVANRLSELALKQAVDELQFAEKSLPLEMRASERAMEMASAELQRWQQKERAMAVEDMDESLKSASYYLEYAEEELKQLEQMYKADEITEATEELILKRTKRDVERSRRYFERQKYQHDLQKNVFLPRRDETVKETALRAQMAHQRMLASAPVTIGQKKLALEKSKFEHAKSQERLAKLRKDRELMTVAAPADGLAYYGRNVRGNWVNAGGIQTNRISRGTAIRPEDVVMTVVSPRPLRIRSNVSEKDLGQLRRGLSGRGTLTAMPEEKFGVSVTAVGGVPFSGTFEVFCETQATLPATVTPAMTCELKFVVFARQALTAPAAAVFTDDRDDDKKYVFIPGGDGKPQRREVKVGRTIDGKTEIIDGLKAGETILLHKPPAA